MSSSSSGRPTVPSEENSQFADSRQLASGASLTLIGRTSGRGLNLVLLVVLARWLGPAGFGLYSLGWTLARILSIVGALGLDHGVIRFGSRYLAVGDQAGVRSTFLQAFAMAAVSGSLLSIGLYAAAPWVAVELLEKPDLVSVLRRFSPLVFLLPVLQVATSATRVSERVRYSVYARDWLQPASNGLLIGIAFYLGWGLPGAVSAIVASYAAAAMLAVVFVVRLFPFAVSRSTGSRVVAGKMIAFSAPAALAGTFGILLVWTDRLMLGYFESSADVGVYHAASQVSVLFVMILAALGIVSAPLIARFHAGGEMERLRALYSAGTRWSVYLSVPAFVLICVFPESLLRLVFEPAYARAWASLLILTCAQFVSVANGSVSTVLVMTGHQREWLMISAVALMSDIGLNIVLIPRWGLEGAAASTAIALGLLFVFSAARIHRYVGVWPFDGRVLKGLVAGAATAVPVLLIRWWLGDQELMAVLVGSGIVVLCYPLSLWTLGLDAEDTDLARVLRTRFLRK